MPKQFTSKQQGGKIDNKDNSRKFLREYLDAFFEVLIIKENKKICNPSKRAT